MDVKKLFTRVKLFFGNIKIWINLTIAILIIVILLSFWNYNVFGNVADWISGIGSVGAIIVVWLQSNREIKRIHLERDRERKEDVKQELFDYVGNLKKLRHQLVGFNVFFNEFVYVNNDQEKPNYDVSLKEIKFISSKINEVVNGCNYNLSKIIEFKNKRHDFEHAINIEVEFSASIMNAKYHLEHQIINWEESLNPDSVKVHGCLYNVYHAIVKYTRECKCNKCIDKTENKTINVLNKEINRINKEIDRITSEIEGLSA